MLVNNKVPIKRLDLPTPYPIGDIYAYLIKDDPVTVVDAGVFTEEVEERWRIFLKENGLVFKDIKRIILTHGHSDHYGFARRLAELCNCKIHINRLDWKKVEDRKGFYERLLSHMDPLGVPRSYLDVFIKVLVWEKDFCLDIPEDMLEPLEDGEIVEFEHLSFKIVHVPGHSMGHIILVHNNWALSGDFVFSNLTPIPVLEADAKGKRIKTALLYMQSVKRVAEMDVKTYFPSHREDRGNFKEAFRAMHERMKRKEEWILECIKEKGGKATVFDVIKCMYPDYKPTDIYVRASEIIGRLDIMESKGLLQCREENGLLFYCLS